MHVMLKANLGGLVWRAWYTQLVRTQDSGCFEIFSISL